jgi:hypothetical protein
MRKTMANLTAREVNFQAEIRDFPNLNLELYSLYCDCREKKRKTLDLAVITTQI